VLDDDLELQKQVWSPDKASYLALAESLTEPGKWHTHIDSLDRGWPPICATRWSRTQTPVCSKGIGTLVVSPSDRAGPPVLPTSAAGCPSPPAPQHLDRQVIGAGLDMLVEPLGDVVGRAVGDE
jgi:hypothetical protein